MAGVDLSARFEQIPEQAMVVPTRATQLNP
jgi:hypothetical protein